MKPAFLIQTSKRILLFIFITHIVGCTNSNKSAKAWDQFPLVTQLKDYPNSQFLTSLESPIDYSKNNIYAASLLMAWQEVKDEINEELTGFENQEMILLNTSKGHRKVLKEDEYQSSVKIEGNRITAKAFFKKSLPYQEKMRRHRNGINFKGDSVKSFGFVGEWPGVRIVYYHSDADFALEITPRDRNHKIIVVKSSNQNGKTFANLIDKAYTQKTIFEKNRTSENSWRHYLADEDFVSMPIIEYNLQTDFPDIPKSFFYAGTNVWKLEELKQRTAFIFNERGAVIESEAEAVSEASEEPGEKPKPKRLILDSNFTIFLKRKDAPNGNPYFAMHVNDARFMKEDGELTATE